ncbi:MAG: hypothetical protein E6645_39420, partial [Bradyrhizobium sp.]|nr:hypothetical protein [Bradyrhizobium sp.]
VRERIVADGIDDPSFNAANVGEYLKAAEVNAMLDDPDAVFIGGGISEPGVFEAAWSRLKPGGRLVANVISLEGEARVTELFGRHGGELIRIAVSRIEPVGRMHGWRQAMPVTQWRVMKP